MALALKAESERTATVREARREAARIRKRGSELDFDSETGRLVSAGPRGVGRWSVGAADVAALRRLHDRIKAGCARRMGWAGGSDEADRRWRCFGLVDGARKALVRNGIMLHSFETPVGDQAAEIERNWASCVDVGMGDEAAAVRRVSESASRAVAAEYAGDVRYERLVALQPNVHGGSEFLPRHLDWPRHDGFGVVIVTVAVRRGATVVLSDETGRDYYFELPEGTAYALSSVARNTCTHGVFCFGLGDRESLNLRYGLHDQRRAEEDVYRHWAKWNAGCGPEGPAYPGE